MKSTADSVTDKFVGGVKLYRYHAILWTPVATTPGVD